MDSQAGLALYGIFCCLAAICVAFAIGSVFFDGAILFWSMLAAAIYLLGGQVRRWLRTSQTHA